MVPQGSTKRHEGAPSKSKCIATVPDTMCRPVKLHVRSDLHSTQSMSIHCSNHMQSLFCHHAIKHDICSACFRAFVLSGRCISCRVSNLFHTHRILAPGRAQKNIPFSLTGTGQSCCVDVVAIPTSATLESCGTEKTDGAAWLPSANHSALERKCESAHRPESQLWCQHCLSS